LKIIISLGIYDTGFKDLSVKFISDEGWKQKIISFLKIADLGIEDILYKKNPSEIIGKTGYAGGNYFVPETETISSVRKIFNLNGEEIMTCKWDIEENESDGTQKFFNYSGVVTTTLLMGKTLVLDEFDARLHPMLTKKIVEMFNSPTINKNGAQLVFVTHDTNLLDNSLLRRDQIYFTEKNKMQETVLYSLADFKGIRNDASYEKDYINGKYGAIPFLGDFEKLFEA
jgi:uncharacterized protein